MATIRQLKSVNLGIPTALGWCLRDVRRAYGVSDKLMKYRNARAAWNGSKTKHYGLADLPKQNVFVPVWIKYGAISTNDHVMLHNPSTGVYYSDDNKNGRFLAYKTYQAWANRVQAWKPSIYGWTEDIEDVRVLEVVSGNNPAPTPAAPAAIAGNLPSRGYWKQGDRGEFIRKAMDFMRKKYPRYTNIHALGPVYGPYAVAAIKEFQRRTRLETDGLIGPITLAKLKEVGLKV